MSTKKLMILATALTVMALASVGMAYGWWTANLTVTGTIRTGSVAAAFDAPKTMDGDGPLAGTCAAGIDANGVLQIEVGSAYPSYVCWVYFTVQNTGTTPVTLALPTGLDATYATLGSCYEPSVILSQGQSTGNCTIKVLFGPDSNVQPNGSYSFSASVVATQYVLQ